MKVLYAGEAPEPLTMTNTGADRKEGLHLSDITRRMTYERDRKLKPDGPIDAMVLERGFTWESILELALSARHERPGYRPDQIQEDGIWMSPDWVNPDGDIQLEEWKATKKSKNRGFDNISWHWMPNSMAYLRALLRRGDVTTRAVRFRIWWINGDYSYESKTSDFHLLEDYWTADVEFTQRELDENWRSILSHAEKYGLLKTPPREEASWRRPRLEATLERRQKEKQSGNPPASSRGKATVVTFPNSKSRVSRRNAS